MNTHGCFTNALKAMFILALFFVLTFVACIVVIGFALIR